MSTNKIPRVSRWRWWWWNTANNSLSCTSWTRLTCLQLLACNAEQSRDNLAILKSKQYISKSNVKLSAKTMQNNKKWRENKPELHYKPLQFKQNFDFCIVKFPRTAWTESSILSIGLFKNAFITQRTVFPFSRKVYSGGRLFALPAWTSNIAGLTTYSHQNNSNM